MKNNTPLVDEHLQSLQGMQETGTDDFFYTRLKARMEKVQPQQGLNLPLKPVWIIGSLVLLLAVNSVMLLQQKETKQQSNTTPIQQLATDYDLTISSSY